MKRLAQLVVSLVLLSNVTFAGHGGIGEKLFFQLGGTIAADVTNMTGHFLMPDNKTKFEFSNLHINYATIMAVGRINFLEMTNNSSLDLAVRPCFGFGKYTNDDANGNAAMLRIPITLDFNSGAAATVSTRAKTGFSFGAGIELTKYPLVNAMTMADEGKGTGIKKTIDFKTPMFIQPVAVFGIKFFGKHYYCRELNFKASFLPSKDMENKEVDNENNYTHKAKDFQSVGLMISFLQYLNY